MKEKILPNGMRIVVIEMPHLHSCEVGIYIGSGSIDDPAGKEGMAHFAEHMSFRGSSLHPSPELLDAAFESIGGNINASTDEETTCYHSRVHPKHLKRCIELFASMMMSPILKGFVIEKRVIIQEIREGLGTKKQNISPQEVACSIIWPESKLGMPIQGFLNSIKATTLDDMKNFIRDNYTPDNTILCVTGAADAEDVFAAADEYFSSWGGKRKPRGYIDDVFHQETPRLELVQHSASQISACIAFRGFSRNDPDLFNSQFLRFALCENSGRLFTNLRGRNGLVYEVYTDNSDFPSVGAFFVNFTSEPREAPKALDESLKELWRLAREPMSLSELTRFKESYIYELDFSQDSDAAINARFGFGLSLGNLRTVEGDKRKVESMTPEIIMSTAKKLFTRANLSLSMVGPLNKKVKTETEAIIARLP